MDTSRWPSPAGLTEIADTLEGLIGRIHACRVRPNESKQPWSDEPKPRRVRVQTFADRMRRHRAEHGSIEHDDLLKILAKEGTKLRQLITGRVVQGWPSQMYSAIDFSRRFLRELANCLGTKGECSVPIWLVRTAEGVLGELRTAKPLEHASRKPPPDKREPSEVAGSKHAAKIPREPVGTSAGTTSSVSAEAQQQSPRDETPGYVWMNASEAARFIGTTDRTIRKWIADHKLTFYAEEGISYKFRQDELEAKKASWRPRKARKAGEKRQSN